MENFDLLAAKWDEEPRRAERAAVIAREIIGTVPGLSGMTGFEYGCGTGLLSFCMRSYLKKIVLADNSEGMLEVLQSKIRENGVLNMEPVKLDLLCDSIPEGTFDIAYTLMTLHHITDLDRIFRELFRGLKHGGYLCIADLDREDGSFHGEGFEGHNGFDRDELSGWLENVGFRNIKSKLCYDVIKQVNGVKRKYPVFLMTAQK